MRRSRGSRTGFGLITAIALFLLVGAAQAKYYYTLNYECPGERDALINIFKKTSGEHWRRNVNWDFEGKPEHVGPDSDDIIGGGQGTQDTPNVPNGPNTPNAQDPAVAAGGSGNQSLSNSTGTPGQPDLPEHCSWDGVYCNVQGIVTGLDFSNFGISAALPDDIGCFPALKTIYLNNNNITAFPEQICNYPYSLQYFQASRANMAGPVPECVCGLEYVSYLYLNENQLNGSLPNCLGAITYLREASFRCNQISSNVSEDELRELKRLPYLSEIDFRCNSVINCTSETWTGQGGQSGAQTGGQSGGQPVRPAAAAKEATMLCGEPEEACGVCGAECIHSMRLPVCGRYTLKEKEEYRGG